MTRGGDWDQEASNKYATGVQSFVQCFLIFYCLLFINRGGIRIGTVVLIPSSPIKSCGFHSPLISKCTISWNISFRRWSEKSLKLIVF